MTLYLRKTSLAAVVVALLAVLLWSDSSAWGSDWKLDQGFAEGGVRLGSGPSNDAPTVWPLRDGGLYSASSVNVSRLRQDGELNTSFGHQGWAWGERSYDSISYLGPGSLDMTKDGRMMHAGVAVQYNEDGDDEYYSYLGRFLPNGQLDRSFAYSGVYPRNFNWSPRYYPAFFKAMAVDGKGSVFVGGGRGDFGVKGERLAATILKFTSRGELDRSFAAGGVYRLPAKAGGRRYQEFSGLEMVGRGRILAAGYSRGRTLLTRLLPSGRRDRSFGGGDGVVTRSYVSEPQTRCIDCGPDMELGVTGKGRIYVLDSTYQKGQGSRARLFAYSPSGRPVKSFGRKGRVGFSPLTEGARAFFPSSFELGSRGEITLVGSRTKLGEPGGEVDSRLALLRLRPNGSRDRSFGENGLLAGVIDADYGRGVVEDFKGRLLVSGIRANVPYRDMESDSIGYAPRGLVARLIPEP